MNALIFTRLAFVICSTYVGYLYGQTYSLSEAAPFAAFILSGLLVFLELGTDILPAQKIFMGGVGLLFGLIIGALVADLLPPKLFGGNEDLPQTISGLVFGYFGLIFALKYADRVDFSRMAFLGRQTDQSATILDTSAIVDGRIKDLIEANFVRGTIVVPSFVIYELQILADSQDPHKRAKGRHGLETLEIIKSFDENLTVYEQDYTDINEVDLKLIQLAKDLDGDILTTDYNLYKIALLHQIRAININQLANVLKPNINIGDMLSVLITKEGKEPGQGVGYLEDGTMVVIDGGSTYINSRIRCSITQILPTSAGRMVFAKPEYEPSPSRRDHDEDHDHQSGRIRSIRP